MISKRARVLVLAAVGGGMLGGAIFRDLFSGPVFGIFIGLVFALLIVGMVTVVLEGPFKFPRRPAVKMTILTLATIVAVVVPFGIMMVMFDPPTWLLIRKVVVYPVPASLSDAHSYVEYAGASNHYLIKFHLAPADVATVTKINNMVQIDSNDRLLASYQNLTKHPPKWWDVGSAKKPRVFRRMVDDYRRVLVYDDATQTGYLIVFPPQPITEP